MKRLYLLMVLSVVSAIVMSTLLTLWISHLVRPHTMTREFGVFPPPLGRVARDLGRALAERPELSPEAALASLGAPVHAPSPTELAAFSAAPLAVVKLPRGGGLTFVSNDGPHAITAWLVDDDGAPRLVSDVLDDGPGMRPGQIAIMIAVAVIVAMSMSFFVTLPLARGMRRLAQAARAIRKGDLTARAGSSGVTRELSVAFDAMADRVEQLLADQQELLQAVSHELRTPTARIRFSLELLDSATTADARERRVAAIDRDLTELDELVSELVTFARVSASSDNDDATAEVEVEQAVTELIHYACDRRPEIDIVMNPAPEIRDVVLDVAPRLFNRALRNVLLNACRFATSRIEIRWERRGDDLAMEVIDDGPGIAEVDRKRVFEPFARADRSRSRDSGGVGLGLAIVRRIVEVHGGSVHADTTPTGGARIILRWPMEPGRGRRKGDVSPGSGVYPSL